MVAVEVGRHSQPKLLSDIYWIKQEEAWTLISARFVMVIMITIMMIILIIYTVLSMHFASLNVFTIVKSSLTLRTQNNQI